MPAPSSYTEDTFAQYLDSTLKDFAEILGWTVAGGSYQETIDETLLAYGVDAIVDVSGRDNIRRLRAVGRFYLWKSVVAATAGNFDFQADGGRFSRSQIHEHAVAARDAAESEVIALSEDYGVSIDSLDYVEDPYRFRPDEESQGVG